MRLTIKVERRSETERLNRWGARKARKLRAKVLHRVWAHGSSYPERGSLRYGDTSALWAWSAAGSGWKLDDVTNEYEEGPVEHAARDFIEALDQRIKELEDPCRNCPESKP